MIDFTGAHYPREVILSAVFFYIRYGVALHTETLKKTWQSVAFQ
jgi:transposase-like protein